VGDFGTILHYDGAAWSFMVSHTTENLKGIWGSATNDIFAVGENGVILHFDGTAWSSMGSNTTGSIGDVWGSSSNNIFAVGSADTGGERGETGFILHYDGHEWSPTPLPPPSFHDSTFSAVWGTSAGHVFAVGGNDYPNVYHYDGSSWSAMTVPRIRGGLTGVGGTSSSDVFAVGNGLIFHYDGSSWSDMSPGNLWEDEWGYEHFSAVWADSGSNVFAAGYHSPGEGEGDFFAAVYHYDGQSWSIMPESILTKGSSRGGGYHAIWGNTGSDVFAGGYPGTMLHYDGTHWNHIGNNVADNREFSGVWGDGENDVFAVGSFGTIVHYNGNAWSNMISGTTDRFTGIWGISGSDVFAATYGGVSHYDGNSWGYYEHGLSQWLSSISGSSPNNVFAVGSTLILHYDGSEWTPTTISDGYLADVWCASDTKAFAVGYPSLIKQYDGAGWTTMMTGDDIWLTGVWGASDTSVFAVGENGLILHYDGTDWSQMVSGTSENLMGVWGTSEHDVFAVGNNGTALHYDGINWNTTDTHTNNSLYGVWRKVGTNAFAVGSDGTILQFEYITVTPTAGLITTEAGETEAFTIRLNTRPTNDVTISLSSSDTTEGTVTPENLVFTSSNWTTGQVVTISGVDDPSQDGDQPFTIITSAASSSDRQYNGINPPDVSVTNSDNDVVLSITLSGTGTGAVNLNPPDMNLTADGSRTYNRSTVVILTATPDVSSNFSGWSGDADCSDGQVTMDMAHTCVAIFSLKQHDLTVDFQGTGTGTVNLNPPDTDLTADGSRPYDHGTAVTLSAIPDGSSTFAGWSGDADCTDGQVSMDMAHTCVATFSLKQHGLTVDFQGTGTGAVNLDPPDTDLTADGSRPYDHGTAVTLSATPDSSSTFAGWSGDADCTDGQVSMDMAHTCVAIFSLKQHDLTVGFQGTGTGTVNLDPPNITLTNGGSQSYDHGTIVTLYATADEGSVFNGWSGDADCSDGQVDMAWELTCVATFNKDDGFQILLFLPAILNARQANQ